MNRTSENGEKNLIFDLLGQNVGQGFELAVRNSQFARCFGSLRMNFRNFLLK